MQSFVQNFQKFGYSSLTLYGALTECVPILTQFSQEMLDSVGFRTMIKTLFVLNGGAYSMIHGLWDLTIQHVSSTISSPFRPCIYKIVSVCSVLSEPVGTPVKSCRYLRRNVFPDLGKDTKAILLLLMGSPSRK